MPPLEVSKERGFYEKPVLSPWCVVGIGMHVFPVDDLSIAGINAVDGRMHPGTFVF